MLLLKVYQLICSTLKTVNLDHFSWRGAARHWFRQNDRYIKANLVQTKLKATAGKNHLDSHLGYNWSGNAAQFFRVRSEGTLLQLCHWEPMVHSQSEGVQSVL